MTITLPPGMDEALTRRALAAGYSSPEEFVSDTIERLMAESMQHEAAVLDGLQTPVAPLTRADLDEVRQVIRDVRRRSTA